MLSAAVALQAAWSDVLVRLDAASIGSMVIAGAAAEITAESFPLPVADAVDGLVVLGASAPRIDDDTTPAATGLASGSVDAFAYLAVGPGSRELDEVVAEARRIVVSGGTVIAGELDTEAVLDGTPGTSRSAAFHRATGAQVPSRSGSVSPTAIALVRGRMADVETTRMLLPLAAFDDADRYIAAVLDGMWLGTSDLSVGDRATLEQQLRLDLRHETFPMVEYRPWIISRGTRP